MKKIILILVMVFASSFVKAEKISVETFFKFPDITSVRISPDGKHLAATVESDGIKRLAVVDLKAMKIKHIFNFNSEKRQIGTYGWLNNERVYATMERKMGPLAIARPTGYLFAGNIDGKKNTQLLPGRSRKGSTDVPRGYRIISLLPKDDEHILISMINRDHTSAYRLNIYRGSKKKIETSPEKYGSLIADHSGAIRVSTSRDDLKDVSKIHIKATDSDDWKLLKEYFGKGVGLTPISISKDNKKLIAQITEKGKQRGLYSIDMQSGEQELLKTIPGDASLSGFIVDNDYYNPEVIGVKRMPGYVETDYINPGHIVAKVVRSLKKSFPEQEVEISNFTEDGKQAVVRVWSDKNPSSFYLFDMESFKLSFMLKTLPWINRKQMQSMQAISFKARDGKEIRGYLTLPHTDAKNVPMVVMVHGGPYGVSDRWGYNSEVQFLANRGYAVLQVNFRGSGGRGAEFQYSAFKQVGREMQDDVTDGTLWAVEQGFANKDKICIYGGSYGGYASMMGVIREPDLYQCAIPYVGAFDIAAFKYDIYHKNKEGRKFAKEAWGYGNDKFMKERSPVHHVDKVKAALFIAHGGKDQICPMEHFDRLTDALDKVGHPYESMVKTYEGHGYRDPGNRRDFYSKMEQFLEKHIGN